MLEEIARLYSSENISASLDYFFTQYNAIGRPFLDVLHIIFSSVFDVLLVFTAVISLIYVAMTLFIVFKKKSHNKASGNEELPFVTIQLPTYNEPIVLNCAKKCLEMDYPKNKYELIIGDDSSDVNVSAAISQFATQNGVTVVRRGSNSGYKAGNLNSMLKHTKGEIIVLFDSDFLPPKNFLKEIVKPFSDKRVAGVQAKWNFVNAEQNMISILGSTIVEVFQSITMKFMWQNRKLAFLCGSAEAVRKEVLVELGGWDHGNLTEDIEFSLRLIKNGYRIEYLYDLRCESEVPYEPKDLYKQQMRWAYGVVSSYIKHAKDIYASKKITFQDKLYTGLICSGYLLTVLLALLFITGLLSVLTHPPAPIDFGKFFFETARNTLITSGLILASVAVCSLSAINYSGRKLHSSKIKHLLKMVASSFSFGLIVAYHVNIGIWKAIFRQPMRWYMLKKGAHSNG